jgi:hypothetical protein
MSSLPFTESSHITIIDAAPLGIHEGYLQK